MRERDIIAHCVRLDHRQLIITTNRVHNSRVESPQTGTSSHACVGARTIILAISPRKLHEIDVTVMARLSMYSFEFDSG